VNSASAASPASGSQRPQVGMALLIALLFGGLVAAGAYADRIGALSPASSGLTQSAAARAQLARAAAATPAAGAKAHGLLAWHAPRIPRIHPPVSLPPRVVTISAPAPAATAPPVAQPQAAAPVAAPTHTSDDSGGNDD
jgi:hypothetical protein